MPVTDDAIDRIKAMIMSGELRPGQRLPRESELADHLGLSRSSLREAVRALALIRVLDVRQGDGTYVTSLEPEVLLDGLGFVVDLHQDDSVLQILGVRSILEPAATAMAATTMTRAQIDGLERLVDAQPAQEGLDHLVAHDLAFHSAVAAGAGNAVLCSLLDSLAGPTTRARIWRGLTEDGALERTHEQHRQIVQAISDRSPDVARAAALVHVAEVERWLRSVLTPARGEPTPPANG